MFQSMQHSICGFLMDELECSFLVEQSAHCLVQNHFERAFDLTKIIHNTVSDFNNTAI